MWILVRWPVQEGKEPVELGRFGLLGELLGWVRERQAELSEDWRRLRAVRDEDGEVRHVAPLMLRYRDGAFREPGQRADADVGDE